MTIQDIPFMPANTDRKTPRTVLPRTGEIRIAPIAVVPELLRELGVAPGPLLRPFGLTEDYFHDCDNPLPYALMGRIIEAATRATVSRAELRSPPR